MKIFSTGVICGSFDLLHPGYIRMFKDTKNVCERVVIALQGDPTVDRPEKCKPAQSLQDREEILRSIVYIDDIVLYNTETDLDLLLGTLEYDVRILGSDYLGREDYAGSHCGNPVYYHVRDYDRLTTLLKQRIADSMSGK